MDALTVAAASSGDDTLSTTLANEEAPGIDDERVLDDAASSILMLQHTEVFSTRTFSLRRRQKEAGVELVNLRAEQKGVLPVNFMHHVSKVVEGRMIFYRVRICRTCSGLPTLTELGSFADVESALLVNDAHEITNGRTKQLHLLAKGDINYLGWLSVRCRGAVEDVPLNQVLGTRILKSSKRKAAMEEEAGPIVLPPSVDLALALQGCRQDALPCTPQQQQQPRSEQQQEEQEHRPVSSSSSSSPRVGTASAGFLDMQSVSASEQPTEKRRVRRKPSPIPPAASVVPRANVNFVSSAGFETVWGLVGAADSLRSLVGVLYMCLDDRVKLQAEHADVDTLVNVLRFSSTPSAAVLALAASLLCGDASAVAPLFTRVRAIVPPDTAPLSSDLQTALVAAIAESRGARAGCTYEKSYQLVWLMNNAAAYFDWTLRLCVLDGATSDDPAALETRLHGAYSLVDVRVGMLLKYLSALAGSTPDNASEEWSTALQDVEKNAIATLVNLQMVMLSAAYLALKACSDPLPLMSCARTCNNFLPRLLQHDTDPCILAMYLQRLLLCHSVLLSTERSGQGFRHARREGVDAFLVGVVDAMQALGLQVVALSRMSFYRLSAYPLGPGMLALYETLFCSYATLFVAAEAIGDERSTFLEDVGLTLGMSELLSLAQRCIDFVQQYTARLKCVVLYTHTMVAMHAFLDASTASPDDLSPASSRYPEVLDIRSKCTLLLSSAASRFLLGQLLLNQSTSNSTKATEPC